MQNAREDASGGSVQENAAIDENPIDNVQENAPAADSGRQGKSTAIRPKR
jgi:hypothetical protein